MLSTRKSRVLAMRGNDGKLLYIYIKTFSFFYVVTNLKSFIKRLSRPPSKGTLPIPWKSMEIYGNSWNSMEIDGNPWNSTKLPWSIHGVSMEFHGVSMVFHGISWSSMEYPWSSMECHGVPRSSMK